MGNGHLRRLPRPATGVISLQIAGLQPTLSSARGATRLLRVTDADAQTSLVEWILVAVVVVAYLALSLSGSPEA